MISVITCTGCPFSNVGLYLHCSTASLAAFTNNGWPRTSFRSSIRPSLLITAVNSTVPCTRADLASGGYCGCTFLIRLAAATLPPTRTTDGGLGGGGGGGPGVPN